MSSPDLNTIESGIWHLYHLLDALVDLADELPHDGTGMGKQDRADTFARCARDLCKEITADVAKIGQVAP